MPHGMCYSYFGNWVRNGSIDTMQQGFFINDYYNLNAVGKRGENRDYHKWVCLCRGAMTFKENCLVGDAQYGQSQSE